jgi:hypothetical protein
MMALISSDPGRSCPIRACPKEATLRGIAAQPSCATLRLSAAPEIRMGLEARKIG